MTQKAPASVSTLPGIAPAPWLTFDAEFQKAGLIASGFHIEAGARRFADYAGAMLADLGEGIRPFLKFWYNAVRNYPGFDSTGMSTLEEVDTAFQSLAGMTPPPSLNQQVCDFVRNLLIGPARPAASELLAAIEDSIGPLARWHIREVLQAEAERTDADASPRSDRDYLRVMLADGSLDAALRGEGAADKEVVSTIDALLRRSAMYRSSGNFRDMITFMAKFRRYSPYNNMLVRTQNPSCTFYATERDWMTRFKRSVKLDARPMLILAPKSPVMLVFDLDQTEGDPLPEHLEEFAQFNGQFDEAWLTRLRENAAGHLIRIDFKPLSSTHGGFATRLRGSAEQKMRIVVHDGLDLPSRFGVLCHEVAHVLLGHLGSDYDGWWPARSNLDHDTAEIEAEAVAHIVTTRLGLTGASASYLAGHASDDRVPLSVSLDTIAKVAGHIEKMATEYMPPRKPRPIKSKP